MKKNIGNVTGAGTSANVSKNVGRRVLAAVLALVFALSCVAGLNFALRAKGEPYTMADNKTEKGGLVLDKGYRQNGEGADATYDLCLEAKATGSVVQKDLPSNSSLDIVMVMDQSLSMEEGKLKTGNYIKSETTRFNVNEAAGKYVFKDGQPYEVESRSGMYVYDSAGNGPWTVAKGGNGSYYYYDSTSDDYYPVKKGTGTLDYTKYTNVTLSTLVETSASLHTDWKYFTAGGSYLAYDATTNDVYPLFYRTKGSPGGYYVEFFYVANHSITASNETAYKNTARHTLSMNGDSQYWFSRDSLGFGTVSSSDKNTPIDVPLYKEVAKSDYTHLYWLQDDADHLIGTEVKIDPSLQPAYRGELFVKGSGYQLFYQTRSGEEIIGKNVKNETDIAYEGTLYDTEKKSRLQVMKDAASSFVEKAGETSGTQIAVVGFDSNANILTSGKTDENAFTTGDEAKTAINSITASSTDSSSLNAGLQSAQNILKNSTTGNNKQIIVVFTDANTTEVNNAKSTSNGLEENGVTIYTVGICNGSAKTALEKLSSEYYGASDLPKLETDTTIYAYCNSEIPEINEATNGIAESIKHSTLTFTIGSDTVLRDILSSNFITDGPNDKNGKTKVTIAVVDGNSEVAKKEIDPSKAGDALVWNGNTITATWEGDEKTLNVEGFDYTANPNKTLRVEITNLEKVYAAKPETLNGVQGIYSNDPNSGIYIDNGTNLFARFPRPFIPYDEETAAAPELHSMNVAIREQFATLTDIVSTLSGNATFQAELLEVDGVSAENSEQWDYDPAIYDNSVELPAVKLSTRASDYDDNDGIADSHEWSTGIIFPEGNVYAENPAEDDQFTFPHAGVYLYKVTQKDIAVGTPKPDTTEYFMKVFVRNSDKKNGEDANGLYIENITVRKGTEAETEKVNYTTDGSAANGFVFQNEYFPESKGSLTVTKKLVASDEEGNPLNGSDAQQVFEFELVVTLSDIVAERTNFTLPNILNDERFTSKEIRRLNGEGSPITMIYGKLRLKSGESLTLEGIPMNAHYVFEETGIPEDTTVVIDGKSQTLTEVTPIPASEEAANSAGLSYFCEDPSQSGAMKNETELATITNQKVAFVMSEPEGISKTVSLGLAGGLIALILLTAGIFFLRIELKKEQ